MEQVAQITQENYREYPAKNYSKLSALATHPSKVLEEKDFSAGMQNGDILDLLCFDKDKFNEKYYVSTLETLPTDAIKTIIETANTHSDEDLLQTARDLQFGAPNWKDATILSKIKENNGEEYIEVLQEADGRRIVSLMQYEELRLAKNKLYNDPWTEMYFRDAEFQKPFVAELEDDDGNIHLCKALLDIYQERSNHIEITDLKFTSSSLMMFPSDFITWKYYLQASLYSDVVEKATGKPVTFRFVVYSGLDKKVLVFEVNAYTRSVAKVGGNKISGYPVKGYQKLLRELTWHEETGLWDFPYEVYEADGVVDLDVFQRQ